MDIFDDTLVSVCDSIDLLPGCEVITYISQSGGNRRIKAVVTRHEDVRILVKNSVVKGISSLEIDTGTDRIEIASRINRVPDSFRIDEIINEDAGFILIKLLGL